MAGVLATPCLGAASEKPAPPPEVELGKLSHVVDNAYFPLATLERAVYAGRERDPDSGEMLEIRMECVVRAKPEKVAGILVTVVEVSEYEDDELVEKTLDYYAQDAGGNVYYIGEKVDDYEDGKVTGHGGQWLAGEKGARPGLFMPAAPKLGDVFEQERAPGVAEDRSTVVAVGSTIEVPAGKFENCIETEDFDPISKSKGHKVFAAGIGLVKEASAAGKSTIELVERKVR